MQFACAGELSPIQSSFELCENIIIRHFQLIQCDMNLTVQNLRYDMNLALAAGFTHIYDY